MNTEELNALKDRAYKTAVEHGLHKDVKPDAYYLGLVMSEAGEAINADRKDLHADTIGFEAFEAFEAAEKDFPFAENFKAHIKDSVEDEIADIVIRLLDYAGLKGYMVIVDLSALPSVQAFIDFHEYCCLPGLLFQLMGGLSDAFDNDFVEGYIACLIGIFEGCFEKMTGSDKDLWWFVEKKMAYNDLRPRLNGKKY